MGMLGVQSVCRQKIDTCYLSVKILAKLYSILRGVLKMGKSMRKLQKKQIEDTIELLEKAHSAIRKAIEAGNQEISLTLLEQCQESAIQIGRLIEDTEGEGFITIGMLESYCEQVYQTYELIRQQQSINIGKVYKNLRRELIRIENSVKNDIKVRTVAVFLPYKASMWDSLESVWQAADADPDCDAYVIPIPYYDKNPDGSFKEIHYEGEEYPDYVPIISWEEYDLALEHPDMIFIHNPYDEFNFITSVPPAYYSKELKKHTDELVYIPYFILGEIEPDDREAVEGIEHFCMVPGVVNADKVIVQSEKMRQIYIDVMSKAMGEGTRKVWEEKILGLGSPKVDRVLNTRREELNIPNEWLRIIEKSDGTWKKVILYNTSVSALLQYCEKMLQKIEDVFNFFKENKDEVALLWRPHPLIKATIESMRPQLWAEYDKLVTKYQEEGWGIYDDTADVDRAIVLSDAYYGDPSSIVHMYKQTGRSILLQDVNTMWHKNCPARGMAIGSIVENEKVHLQYRSGIRVKDKFYFSAMYFNGLFEMDLNDFSAKLICHFSGENRAKILMHTGSAIEYKNVIYFFPLSSRQIHCYDLIMGEEHNVVIPISDGEEFMTAGTAQRENKIWLFPSDSSIGVFIFDMEDQTVIIAEALSEQLQKYGKTIGLIEVLEERRLFTYCVNDSILLEINLERGQIKEYKVPLDDIDVCSFNYHDGRFCFIDAVSGDLYEWTWNNTNLQKYEARYLERVLVKGAPFCNYCLVNGDIYMIPGGGKYVMKVKEEGIMEQAFEYPEDFQYLDNLRTDYASGMMNFCEVVQNEIWFHPCGGNQLLIYDTISEQTIGRKITIDVGSVFPSNGIFFEYNRRLLEYFCHNVRKNEQCSTAIDELCGSKIYQIINE